MYCILNEQGCPVILLRGTRMDDLNRQNLLLSVSSTIYPNIGVAGFNRLSYRPEKEMKYYAINRWLPLKDYIYKGCLTKQNLPRYAKMLILKFCFSRQSFVIECSRYEFRIYVTIEKQCMLAGIVRLQSRFYHCWIDCLLFVYFIQTFRFPCFRMPVQHQADAMSV